MLTFGIQLICLRKAFDALPLTPFSKLDQMYESMACDFVWIDGQIMKYICLIQLSS